MTPHNFFPDSLMLPAQRAVFALVTDTGVKPTYKYHVIGTDSTNARVVLVSAKMRGNAKETLTLKIVTVPDARADRAPRFDLLQSLNRNIPNHRQRLLEEREAERKEHEAERKALGAERAAVSMSNLKQIALAILMYAQAHNDRLPDADHWVDEVLPYCLSPKATPAEKERASKSLFRDPTAPVGQQWTYAFNRNLSHVSLSALKDPARTVLVFESTTATKNAADTGRSLPHPGWHSGGSHIAFADGHVKLIPDQSTADTPAPKFAP
jgi:prepilin-type processing-associated H-X9-DG protein